MIIKINNFSSSAFNEIESDSSNLEIFDSRQESDRICYKNQLIPLSCSRTNNFSPVCELNTLSLIEQPFSQNIQSNSFKNYLITSKLLNEFYNNSNSIPSTKQKSNFC